MGPSLWSTSLATENRRVVEGTAAPAMFVARWSERIAELASAPPNRHLVHLVGMIVCSIERHGRQAGHRPGWAMRRVPFAEAVLKRLALPGDPPRDVLVPYLTGPDFVGGPVERNFKADLIQVGNAYTTLVEMVAPLRRPDAFLDRDAARRLRDAAAFALVATSALRRRAGAVEDDRIGLPTLREFWCPLSVGGVRYEGIDTAHHPAVFVADLVLGTADVHYRSHVAAGRRHLVAEDKAWFDRVAAGPSVLDALREAAGARSPHPFELARALRDAPLAVREAAVAMDELLHRHAAAGAARVAVYGQARRDGDQRGQDHEAAFAAMRRARAAQFSAALGRAVAGPGAAKDPYDTGRAG